MKLHIEVKDHKVELIKKLLEHIPFVKIQESGSPMLSARKLTTQSKLLRSRNKRSLTQSTAD